MTDEDKELELLNQSLILELGKRKKKKKVPHTYHEDIFATDEQNDIINSFITNNAPVAINNTNTIIPHLPLDNFNSQSIEEPPLDDEIPILTLPSKKRPAIKNKPKAEISNVLDIIEPEIIIPRKVVTFSADPISNNTVLKSYFDKYDHFPFKKNRRRVVYFDNFAFKDIFPSLGSDINTLTFSDGDTLKNQLEDNYDASKLYAYIDRDYFYDELLARAIFLNPKKGIGEKRKIVMKPPHVVKIGARRTSFVNFTETCKALHRQPKHVLAYLLSELGSSGAIDGSNQLIIRGRFQGSQIESVLRSYIKQYVTCHTCKSPDSLLQKEKSVYFLQCETCGSKCSVASIKQGYVHTINRAATRNN